MALPYHGKVMILRQDGKGKRPFRLRERMIPFAMILEVAILNVRPGQVGTFEAAFRQASPIIASMPGYLGHGLQRCLEFRDQYVLLVRWQKLADHTVGFRGSARYQEWKALPHHFYDPFPVVEHYEPLSALAPRPAAASGASPGRR